MFENGGKKKEKATKREEETSQKEGKCVQEVCAGSVCRSVKKNEKYKNSDSTRGKGGYYSRTSILFLKLRELFA
jgi:hypothetical protein